MYIQSQNLSLKVVFLFQRVFWFSLYVKYQAELCSTLKKQDSTPNKQPPFGDFNVLYPWKMVFCDMVKNEKYLPCTPGVFYDVVKKWEISPMYSRCLSWTVTLFLQEEWIHDAAALSGRSHAHLKNWNRSDADINALNLMVRNTTSRKSWVDISK